MIFQLYNLIKLPNTIALSFLFFNAYIVEGICFQNEKNMAINADLKKINLALTKRFTPDTNYQLLFIDEFIENHISQHHHWWKPRIEAKKAIYANSKHPHGPFIGYNRASNNSIDNGILAIHFNKDADGKYYGGGIISNKTFGYGYYEAKVKIYTGSYGLHQSFWSNEAAIEIDGFEIDSKLVGLAPLQPGRHRWRPTHIDYQPTPEQKKTFVKMPNTILDQAVKGDDGIWTDDDADWVTVGYEWLPNEVRYYVNGNLQTVYGLIDAYGHDVNVYQPAKIYLTALPFDVYEKRAMEAPQPGAKMQVEYVAYYTKPLLNVNLLGNASFDYVHNSDSRIEARATAWDDYPIKKDSKIIYGDSDLDTAHTRVRKEAGNWFLEQTNTKKDYKAQASQTLYYIPNGKYQLTARIKTSLHSKKNGASLMILDKNKNLIKSYPITTQLQEWTTITLKDIVVKAHEVTILISSHAKKGEYLLVDDIDFSLQSR